MVDVWGLVRSASDDSGVERGEGEFLRDRGMSFESNEVGRTDESGDLFVGRRSLDVLDGFPERGAGGVERLADESHSWQGWQVWGVWTRDCVLH